MAEGSITIDILAKADKFDKQIADLEKKIAKEEKNLQIKSEIKIQAQQSLEEQRKEVEKLAKEVRPLLADAEKYYTIMNKIKSGKQVSAQDYQAFKSIEGIIPEYNRLSTELLKANQKQQQLEISAKKTENAYQNVADKVTDYKNKINSINLQKQQADVNKLKSGINGVGNSIQGAIKKASKFALAIFGIRSAYLALRRASSDLASYDEQYATNLEYIRFVLTQAIAPVLRYIVELAMKLLSYINAIAQAWFGVNLFANGSVEAFQKMKAGASGVGKAVKEIKKQLLGFDEINVLTDQSDTGTSAGAGGVGLPSLDLSQMQGDIPDWLKWIIDHGEIARTILEGLGAAFLALKFGLGGLAAVGIFLIIKGIEELVKDIQAFVDNPTIKKLGEIIQDIGLIILGIAAVVGSVPLAVIGQIALMIGGIVEWVGALLDFIENPSWEGWTEMIRAGIKSTGILGYAIDWLIENVFGGWDQVTDLLKTVGTWLYDNVIQPIYTFFEPLINFFKSIFDTIWNNLKVVIDNVSQIIQFSWNNFMRGVNVVAGFFKNIINTVWSNLKVIIDNVKIIFNAVKEYLYNLFRPVVEFFSNIFTQVVNKIKSVFSPIFNYFSDLWNRISSMFRDVAIRIGEAIGGVFKNAINGVLSAVERILNSPIRTINGLINSIRNIPRIRWIKNIKYI